jgi:hypothetical protein
VSEVTDRERIGRGEMTVGECVAGLRWCNAPEYADEVERRDVEAMRLTCCEILAMVRMLRKQAGVVLRLMCMRAFVRAGLLAIDRERSAR